MATIFHISNAKKKCYKSKMNKYVNFSINLVHTQQIKTFGFLLVATRTVCDLAYLRKKAQILGIKRPRPSLWYCYFGAPSLIQPVFVGFRSDLPILVAAVLSLLCHNVLNHFLQDFLFYTTDIFLGIAKISEMNQFYF